MMEEFRSTDSASTGKFCFEEVDGIAVPFIIRSSGIMLAELNMLKNTLFKKHMQVLRNSIFDIACSTLEMELLFRMTDNESALLDEINTVYCDDSFSMKPQSKASNFLMRKKDVVKLYQILETFHDIVITGKLENSRCGFMKIDDSDTPVPFVDVHDVGVVVPLFFFDCPEVTETAFALTDHWSTTYLRLCCKLLSILPTLYEAKSIMVVKLNSLKTVVSGMKQIRTYGTLPFQARVTQFLRPALSPKVALKETPTFNRKVQEFPATRSRILLKRRCKQAEGNADDIFVAKRVKPGNSHTIEIEPTESIITSLEESDKFTKSNKPQANWNNIGRTKDQTTYASHSSRKVCLPKGTSLTPAESQNSTNSSITSILRQVPQGGTSSGPQNTVRLSSITEKRKEIIAVNTSLLNIAPKGNSTLESTIIPSEYESVVHSCSGKLGVQQLPTQTHLLQNVAMPAISTSVTSTCLPVSNTDSDAVQSLINTGLYMKVMTKPPKNLTLQTVDVVPQSIAPTLLTSNYAVLDACNGPGLTPTGSILRPICNMGQSTDVLMQQPGIMTPSFAISDNIPTIMNQKEWFLVNLSGTLTQQPLGIVRPTGTLVNQNETLIAGLKSATPSIYTIAQQHNFMTLSTGEQQQGHIVYSNINSQQGAQTFLVSNSRPFTVNTFNVDNNNRASLSMQQSQVNATNSLKIISKAGVKPDETQSSAELQDKTIIKTFKSPKKTQSKPAFVNLSAKIDNSQLKTGKFWVPPFNDTSSAENIIENSGIVAQPSITSLPEVTKSTPNASNVYISSITSLPEVTTSTSNSSNVFILQPNSDAQSSMMTQVPEEFAPNTALITQNGVMTPVVTSSGNTANCWNFLGNGSYIPQVLNSGQILTNQSGFMVNSNNILTSSNGFLVSQPNISNFQNIIATLDGLIVCPNTVINSSNTTNEANIVSQPNNVGLQGTYAVHQNTEMVPNSSHSTLVNNLYNTVTNQPVSSTQPNNSVPCGNNKMNGRKPESFITTILNKGNKTADVLAHIQTKPNEAKDMVTVPSSDVVMKRNEEVNTYDVKDVSKESVNSDVIDTIISDENMEKLVVCEGKDREVLYKVIEIPEFKNVDSRTAYKVVKLKLKRYNFLCVSLDPFSLDRLLISVLEVTEKLFPKIPPKTFMTIAKEVKLEVYSLNTAQKAVLRQFYGTTVREHLYFLYKKFIVIYETIKGISQRVYVSQKLLQMQRDLQM